MARFLRFSVVAAAALGLAACSSSGPKTPTVGAARTYQLAQFKPGGAVRAHTPVRISFRIDQPSGKTLTAYRRGAGPHTGVHLIFVRSDLALIIHRHPPIARNGTATDTVTFPSGGRWRVLVDAYPKKGPPNFQLHTDIRVSGAPTNVDLGSGRTDIVDGYRVTYRGPLRLKAIQAAIAPVTVTAPDGRPARFHVWFGALAHAIFFRDGSLDYFHTHVCGPNTPGCTTGTGGARISGRVTRPGRLNVGILLPTAGTWRMFLQFQTNGRVITAPFTLDVR